MQRDTAVLRQQLLASNSTLQVERGGRAQGVRPVVGLGLRPSVTSSV